MIQFNFLTSFILFVVILLPIIILLIVRTHNNIYGRYKIAFTNVMYLIPFSLILLIVGSVISILQGEFHLIFLVSLTLTNILLMIGLFTNVSYSVKQRIYLFYIFIIVLVYSLTVSSINSFNPAYRDNVRDVLVVNRIINDGSIYNAQELLKNTEPYYSTLPLFQLLLTSLVYITGNVNSAYILIGIVQLLGIILGMAILLLVIRKYVIDSKNKVLNNGALIRSDITTMIPLIGSLLIVGLPYGFFTILATQPQSMSLLLSLVTLHSFIILMNKNRSTNKYIILIFAVLVFISNVYHAVMSILLFIVGLAYMLHNYKKMTTIRILTIIILVVSLIIIYWLEPSSILRIYRIGDRIIDAFQQTEADIVTKSVERFSPGLKFFAYSYAFILSIITSVLLIVLLSKTKVISVNRSIFSSFTILFAVIIIIFVILAFTSVTSDPSKAGSLGRYLLGQGAIFILSLIIITNVLSNIMTVDKWNFVIVICLLFIYNLSGLTQFYWTPDYNASVYSLYSNYLNINAIFPKLEKERDLIYMHPNIYILADNEDTIKLYKARTQHPTITNNLLEVIDNKVYLQTYLIRYHNIGSDESLLIFIPDSKEKQSFTNSSFNKLFASNRYTLFSTSLYLVQN